MGCIVRSNIHSFPSSLFLTMGDLESQLQIRRVEWLQQGDAWRMLVLVELKATVFRYEGHNDPKVFKEATVWLHASTFMHKPAAAKAIVSQKGLATIPPDPIYSGC